MRKPKASNVSTLQERVIKPLVVVETKEVEERNDLILWTSDSKRVKSFIIEDAKELFRKLEGSKPKDVNSAREMIDIHNEYRFPLVQLDSINQKNVGIAYEFLIFLNESK